MTNKSNLRCFGAFICNIFLFSRRNPLKKMSDINANKLTLQARSLSLSGSRYSLVDSPTYVSPVPTLPMQHKGFKPPFASTAAAQGEV